MEITKHITYLLQFHECVVIPEFGGFITNYKPAVYNPLSHTFNPPSKEVVFNSKINKNDGLLINHLVDVERIGYQQAQTAVMNFTDQLFDALNNGKKVDFEQLGSFEFDRTGTVLFTPATRFDLIEAYGLKPFSFPAIEHSKNHYYQARPAVRALHRHTDLIKVAATAALLLTLALFPVKNEEMLQSSNLIPFHLFTSEQTVYPETSAVDENLTNDENLVLTSSAQKGYFVLVGGSFQHLGNATDFKNELLANGHQAEIIIMENGNFRVIVDSYSDKSEALQAMESYRSAHTGSKVWVSTR
jgi:hypothetical protein